MNKKIIVSLFFAIALSSLAIGAWNWNFAVIVNVAPNSCVETDSVQIILLKEMPLR